MVKAMKDTNSYPYGMLLTRIFRESGVLLDRKDRAIMPVRSFIDSTTIAKMGLRNLDKAEAESQRKARTEGERSKQKSPSISTQSQTSANMPVAGRRRLSEEAVREKNTSKKESSKVRVIKEGALKRKGETLLSEIPKQTRRSPRVRTVRQQEEKQSRELKQVENSELRAPKATRSLVSILREDSAKQAKELERKRKLELEKQKQQSQKTPRLIEAQQKEKVSQKEITPVAEKESQEKIVSTTQELSLENVTPSLEEVSQETTIPTVVQTEEPAEHSEAQDNSLQPLRKEDLEIRITEEIQPEKKKSNSIIIKEVPRKEVKVHFRPISVNSRTAHLLSEDEKSFYEHLQIIGKKPYPTQMTNQPHTIFPITEDTVIKVVPDIQPRRPVERNNDKGKMKLYPEPAEDDLTAEQIEEEVRLIDEACFEAGYVEKKVTGMVISHHISEDPGTSGSRSSINDPVGGDLIEGQFNTIKVGDMVCLIEPIVKAILRRRPLWQITSMEDILPFLGRPAPRLPVPDDLDLPEPYLPVQPPTLQIIEASVQSSDAYNTTISFEEEQPQVDDQPAAAPDLQAQVASLCKEFKKIKKMMKKLMRHFQL